MNFPETIYKSGKNGVAWEYTLCETFASLPSYAIYYRKSGKHPERIHSDSIGKDFFLTEEDALLNSLRIFEYRVKAINERLLKIKQQ